jgi:hypothetical protein
MKPTVIRANTLPEAKRLADEATKEAEARGVYISRIITGLEGDGIAVMIHWREGEE